jgi:hypothetical protein
VGREHLLESLSLVSCPTAMPDLLLLGQTMERWDRVGASHPRCTLQHHGLRRRERAALRRGRAGPVHAEANQSRSRAVSVPCGIRTRVSRLRVWDPRPLNERDRSTGSGARTRLTGLKDRCPDLLDHARTELRRLLRGAAARLDDLETAQIRSPRRHVSPSRSRSTRARSARPV